MINRKTHLKFWTAFVFMFCLLPYIAAAQNVWTQKANFGGGPRYAAAGFSIGTKGYIGTGITHVGNVYTYYNDFWEWDQATNAWTQKASLPGASRYGATGFSIGSKGYITTGWTPAAVQDLWEYDPAGNSWLQKTNFGGPARYDDISFVLGGYAYVGTGYAPYSSDFWKYDPVADTWTQIANIGGGGRSAAAAFSDGHYGYVANGGTQFVFYSQDLWCYDPGLNSWSQLANFMGAGRVGNAAFFIGGKGYVGTGCTSNSVFTDFYSYDPALNSWAPIASFPGQGLVKTVSFSIGAYGYVGTGSDNIYLPGVDRAEFWQYGPTAPPAVASFQSDDSTICEYGCVNFTDKSTNATSWLWSFPGGAPSSSTLQNPQKICYYVHGQYNVTLIASNGAGSDTLKFLNFISVNPAPVVPGIIKSNDTLFCTSDTSFKSFQWYYNGTQVPGQTDTFMIANADGNYNLAISNVYGCSIAVGINIETGLDEQKENTRFNVYPNPVTENLVISMLRAFDVADVEVFDATGRKLYDQMFRSASGDKYVIDFKKFAAGIYFVSVTADGNRGMQKVIRTNQK